MGLFQNKLDRIDDVKSKENKPKWGSYFETIPILR